ncbi:MAG TPA: hypothetical protein DER07_09700 [Armatimonadetes bacterium]|jgi:hypothetical protein|nr:hypothetical protein [Armatimonadota bacterium]HCE01302.1 hypothetical protein [Armatimonadota bacterium]
MGNGALDRNRPDTRETESFLQSQEGVLDASVWYHEGKLVANLVIHRYAVVDLDEIRVGCARELGDEKAPSLILVMREEPARR